MISAIASDSAITREDRNDLTQVVVDATLGPFNRVIKSYVAFNFLFLFLGTAELLALTVFFSRLSDSAVVALTLALFFLTLFTYFILRIYLLFEKAGTVYPYSRHVRGHVPRALRLSGRSTRKLF